MRSLPVEGLELALDPCSIKDPAVYVVELDYGRRVRVAVGALGDLLLKPGRYYYVGSAKRGLSTRAPRHLVPQGRRRWHIDHISSIADARSVWWAPFDSMTECSLAEAFSKRCEPVPGFGCSDCSCTSHLFREALR